MQGIWGQLNPCPTTREAWASQLVCRNKNPVQKKKKKNPVQPKKKEKFKPTQKWKE